VNEIVLKTPTQPFTYTESAETGLFITGLKTLRKMLKMREDEDPCDVVHLTLKNVGAASY